MDLDRELSLKKIPEHQFIIKPLGYECLTNAINKHQLNFIITSPAHLVALESGGAKALATLQSQFQGLPLNSFGAVMISLAQRTDLNDLTNLKTKALSPARRLNSVGFK